MGPACIVLVPGSGFGVFQLSVRCWERCTEPARHTHFGVEWAPLSRAQDWCKRLGPAGVAIPQGHRGLISPRPWIRCDGPILSFPRVRPHMTSLISAVCQKSALCCSIGGTPLWLEWTLHVSD